VNGWDSLSEAVKILGPSGLTAFVALRLARLAQSHEQNKERRRRRQDALETVVELFEQGHVDMTDISIAYQIKCDIEDLPKEKQTDACERAKEHLKKGTANLGSIRRSLGIMRARLLMLKAADAVEALEGYRVICDRFVRSSVKTDAETRKKMEDMWEELQPARQALVQAIAEAYDEPSQ